MAATSQGHRDSAKNLQKLTAAIAAITTSPAVRVSSCPIRGSAPLIAASIPTATARVRCVTQRDTASAQNRPNAMTATGVQIQSLGT